MTVTAYTNLKFALNRHQPVLAEGQAILRMARDLQQKATVPPLKEQLPFGGCRTGKPQSTKGRELKAKFCFCSSRFARTKVMPYP
jgi:hypothetical protein